LYPVLGVSRDFTVKPLADPDAQSHVLAQAIKSVRLLRGRSTADLAKALGLSLRTYERWESGDAHLSFASVIRFAEVTDSDPIALVIAMIIRDPDFAVDAADNKLALMVVMTLADLHGVAGDKLRHLTKTEIRKHLQVVLQALGTSALQTSESADDWIAARLAAWSAIAVDGPVKPREKKSPVMPG
jgi:transcriptional regulator with XRE-family HTH domain